MTSSSIYKQHEIFSKSKHKKDYDSVMLIIRKNDSTSLEKLLTKSADILNYHQNGWYPLHEAVKKGHVDVAKLIVKFATECDEEAVNNWDQAMTTCRIHDSYICVSYPQDKDGRKPQASFLEIAVEKKKVEMSRYVCSLYNKKCNKGPLLMGNPIKRNRGIYEAIVISFTFTASVILRVLLQGLRNYFDLSLPDDFSEIAETALYQNALLVIGQLLQFGLGLNDSERKKYALTTLEEVGIHCVQIAHDYNDETVLQVLLDAMSFKSIAEIDEHLSGFGFGFLKDSCLCSSARVTEFLVSKGCDVYAFGEDHFDDLFGYFDYPGWYDVWDYRYEKNKHPYKTSAIFWAVRGFGLDILKYLITVVDQRKLQDLPLVSPVVSAVMVYSSAPLELLLENGYSIDIKQSLPYSETMFLEYTLFHRYFAVNQELLQHGRSTDCLKILLKWGALELAFGQRDSTASAKKFLENQWFYIDEKERKADARCLQSTRSVRSDPGDRHSKMMGMGHICHPRIPWFNKFDVEFYVEKFGLLLQHIALYRVTDGKSLEETTLSLKQLCRFVIRCSVVQKMKTLKPMHELNLPNSLLKYLFYE